MYDIEEIKIDKKEKVLKVEEYHGGLYGDSYEKWIEISSQGIFLLKRGRTCVPASVGYRQEYYGFPEPVRKQIITNESLFYTNLYEGNWLNLYPLYIILPNGKVFRVASVVQEKKSIHENEIELGSIVYDTRTADVSYYYVIKKEELEKILKILQEMVKMQLS
jgi:hypothetical protein